MEKLKAGSLPAREKQWLEEALDSRPPELLELAIPCARDLRVMTEYRRVVRPQAIYDPRPVIGNYEVSLKFLRPGPIINKLRVVKRNKYMINNLLSIGGGGDDHCITALSHKRVGCTTQDRINYLCHYRDKCSSGYAFRFQALSTYRECFGGRRDLTIAKSSTVLREIEFKFDAGPGALFRGLGADKKELLCGELALAFKTLYVSWCTHRESKIRPAEIWTAASRPKLKKIGEMVPGLHSCKAQGRVISMPGPMEQLIGYPIYYPLSRILEQRRIEVGDNIMIGIDRNGGDWERIASNFPHAAAIYTGDWSCFDQSIPSRVLVHAIDLMLAGFSTKCQYTRNYICNFRRYFMENHITKRYIVDGAVDITVPAGIASGSIWTSMLGSVCNMIIIRETLSHIGIQAGYKLFIYSDDHLILFDKHPGPDFMVRFHEASGALFGVAGSVEDSYLSNPAEYYVQYWRPVFPPGDYSGGTRNVRPIRVEESLAPFENWDHSKGTTHRWNYRFVRRPRFLQFYWTATGSPLRPWKETLLRLVNPEQSVPDPLAHKALLLSHLQDNYNNAHVRNWIMHCMYDTGFISRAYDWKRGCIPPYMDLSRGGVALKVHKQMPAVPGYRAWYRRVDGYVDIMSHPGMRSFLHLWAYYEGMARKVADHIRGYHFYERRNIFYRAVYRGYLGTELSMPLLRERKTFKEYVVQAASKDGQLSFEQFKSRRKKLWDAAGHNFRCTPLQLLLSTLFCTREDLWTMYSYVDQAFHSPYLHIGGRLATDARRTAHWSIVNAYVDMVVAEAGATISPDA